MVAAMRADRLHQNGSVNRFCLDAGSCCPEVDQLTMSLNVYPGSFTVACIMLEAHRGPSSELEVTLKATKTWTRIHVL